MPKRGERLLPALLDRLSDDHPEQRKEAARSRVVSRNAFRRSVLRDLAWLLNTTNAEAETDFGDLPARRSVLNFGIVPLAGVTVTGTDWQAIETAVREAILAFEPRIIPETLAVRLVGETEKEGAHNEMAMEIKGQLWCQPYPMELLLRSRLDLESGQVFIEDLDRQSR